MIALLTGVISESMFEKNQIRIEEERMERETKRKQIGNSISDLFDTLEHDEDDACSHDQIRSILPQVAELFEIYAIAFAYHDLENVVDLMDVDCSGQISKSEFTHGILSIAEGVRPMSMIELFHAIHVVKSKVEQCDSSLRELSATMHGKPRGRSLTWSSCVPALGSPIQMLQELDRKVQESAEATLHNLQIAKDMQVQVRTMAATTRTLIHNVACGVKEVHSGPTESSLDRNGFSGLSNMTQQAAGEGFISTCIPSPPTELQFEAASQQGGDRPTQDDCEHVRPVPDQQVNLAIPEAVALSVASSHCAMNVVEGLLREVHALLQGQGNLIFDISSQVKGLAAIPRRPSKRTSSAPPLGALGSGSNPLEQLADAVPSNHCCECEAPFKEVPPGAHSAIASGNDRTVENKPAPDYKPLPVTEKTPYMNSTPRDTLKGSATQGPSMQTSQLLPIQSDT